MTSMNVSLPDELKAYVDLRLGQDGYSSASEYVRMLIRQDRENKGREQLRAALIQGLNSGELIEADAAYWKNKQALPGVS
jgi:antitoxin ParD1/3/4